MIEVANPKHWAEICYAHKGSLIRTRTPDGNVVPWARAVYGPFPLYVEKTKRKTERKAKPEAAIKVLEEVTKDKYEVVFRYPSADDIIDTVCAVENVERDAIIHYNKTHLSCYLRDIVRILLFQEYGFTSVETSNALNNERHSITSLVKRALVILSRMPSYQMKMNRILDQLEVNALRAVKKQFGKIQNLRTKSKPVKHGIVCDVFIHRRVGRYHEIVRTQARYSQSKGVWIGTESGRDIEYPIKGWKQTKTTG